MVFAPVLGNPRIPRRLKALIAAVLSLAVARGVAPPVAPAKTLTDLTFGIGGELIFGLIMGMVLSFTFIAAQWAGDLIGQQVGINMSETLDPQLAPQSTIMGDLYYMLTTVVFLCVNGHLSMIRGVRDSFDRLPLLSVGMNQPLLALLIDLFNACTHLALQLAAPVMVTLLVVDLSMGFIGKTMPQLGVMSAGVSVRALVGMIVLIIGIGLSMAVVRDSVMRSMGEAYHAWTHIKF